MSTLGIVFAGSWIWKCIWSWGTICYTAATAVDLLLQSNYGLATANRYTDIQPW